MVKVKSYLKRAVEAPSTISVTRTSTHFQNGSHSVFVFICKFMSLWLCIPLFK